MIAKKILKTVGVVALLLVMYAIFQALFTFIAILFAFLLSGNLTSFQECAMDTMSYGLFASALAMLLFIHFTKFFRLRLSIFRSISPKPLAISTALVFVAMFALNIFVQWFPLKDNLELQFDGIAHNLVGAFTISFLAPLLEEVMFRGAIQGYIMRTFGKPWLAIVVASLVFGIFHWNPVQVVYATLLGLIFGWIYYRTGSLLSVIVGHILNNTIATFTMLFLANVDESEISNSSSGYLYFVVFAVISVVLAILLHRSLPQPPSPWHESDVKPSYDDGQAA